MRRWLAVLLTAALAMVCGAGCGDAADSDAPDASPADQPGDDDAAEGVAYRAVTIVPAADAPPAVRLAAQDAASLLRGVAGLSAAVAASPTVGDASLNVMLGAANQTAFAADELSVMPAESFRLRTIELDGADAVAIAGADARGLQHGLYELLERLGFRFFHPEQTFTPRLADLAWPAGLDVYERPDWGRRGFHFHTMHPIEASEFLMVASPQHEQWAKRLIDWLARNKQNYWQFELLRTVDYDALVPYYRGLVDYSHARQVDAGLVVTWVFQQQKAWKLLPNARAEHKAAMQKSLDQLLQAPWDHLNLEMGGTEFTAVEDTLQVAWMNNTAAYLAEKYPSTTCSVKVHCSSDQTAPHYGDINFNYLPQVADQRVGVYPHTVMYYDLRGPAPVYDNEDFSALYTWMLSMIDGPRKVYYYPETAYWCSFDIDVPLFLPIYPYNRWKDMNLLADKGLDGHVNFTSGHEWGYWLSDWAVARYGWNSQQPWTDALERFAAVFGDAGPAVAASVRDLGLAQEEFLIGRNLASYLAGEDTWDELGYVFGATTHPQPLMFKQLYKMDEAGVRGFAGTTLADLEAMKREFGGLLGRLEAACADAPENARPWCDELVDGFRVDALRASHAYRLWAGASARRLAELGVDPNGEAAAQAHFDQARALTREFLQTVRRREARYRYPLEYSIGWKRSVTSYDFRYLYQASNGYWFRRYERQAIDKKFNYFLMNVIDPIWFFF